jgi:PncC family amidohydrolase
MKQFFINLKPLFIRLFSKREQVLGRILLEKNLKISTTESCTGGLLSSRLTDVSGSSSYVFANFVTYSNDAKQSILGVSAETLKNFGAVSRECADEMVKGLFNKTHCDIAIATTGIAGPNGDENKPVGLIYIGICTKDEVIIKKFEFNPLINRKNMKFMFSEATINLAIETLK